MTWFELIGSKAFKSWLIGTSGSHILSQGSKLDPFVSSMRKFHNAQSWMSQINEGTELPPRSGGGKNQKYIDLKSAGLLVPSTGSAETLSALGKRTLEKWETNGIPAENDSYEVPRSMIVLQEAGELQIQDYQNYLTFWRDVRSVFSFSFIISYPEILYFVSLLDRTYADYNPWSVIATLQLGDQYFNNGVNWQQVLDFYGSEVDEAVKKYESTIEGYASREGRSNFCTAMEILTGMTGLKEIIDISELSGEVKKLIQELASHSLTQNIAAIPPPLPSLPQNRILYGPPGAGKSHRVDEVYAKGHAQIRLTFHPDSDYYSFVGAYKPVSDADGQIRYDFVAQAFIKAYLSAWSQPERAVFLIIEEINRGNCAQVFGDLFQCLERNERGSSKYPVDADTDLAAYLNTAFKEREAAAENFATQSQQYPNIGPTDYHKIILPPNLYLFATMNTSDQSLFPMDSAFKRRWDWEYVPIDYQDAERFHIVLDDGTRYSWAEFIRAVNREIYELNQSEDKQLGNRFVNPADGVITQAVFKSKVMFYLWSEIYKHELRSSRNIFAAAGTSATNPTYFTFSQLYENDEDGNPHDQTLLTGFMDRLGLQPEPLAAAE